MFKKILYKLLSIVLCKEVISGFQENGIKGVLAGAKAVREKRTIILDNVNKQLGITNSDTCSTSTIVQNKITLDK